MDEQLAPDERAEAGIEAVGVEAADGPEAGQREALAEDGRVADERAIAGFERVEAGGDERLERGRHGQVGEVDRPGVVAVGRC